MNAGLVDLAFNLKLLVDVYSKKMQSTVTHQ
jgi:hypothetical protein